MTGVFAPERRALSWGILVSISAIAFESLAVATVLPSAALDLDGVASYGWAFSAFLLASLIGGIQAGQLADRRGPGAPALVGFAAFGGGLLISGLAPNWPALLLGRALQGVGGGALVALAYLAVARGFPDKLRPRILALLSSAWIVPALVGPAIAGQIAELVSWRVVFLGLLPLVLGGGLLFARALTGLPIQAGPAEVSGRALASVRLAVGVGLVLWGSGLAIAGPAALVVAVAGCVLAGPALAALMPRGTFLACPGLAAGAALRGLLAFGFFGCEALIPLGLTTARGLPPSEVGFALSATALTWVAASWLQERADAHDGGAGRMRRVQLGLALLIVGIAGVSAAIVFSALPAVLTAVTWGIGGLGMGLAYPANTVLALGAAPPGREGEASASLQVAETVGTAVGTGASGALFALALQFGWGASSGLGVAFSIAAAAIVLAFIPSFRLAVSDGTRAHAAVSMLGCRPVAT